MPGQSILASRVTTLVALLLGAFLVATLAVAVGHMDSSAAGLDIVVNATDDANNHDATCSLREAILAANSDTQVGSCVADDTSDSIVFDLGPGVPSINVLHALPDITGTVTIDGATGGADRVELNGGGINANGLTIKARDVQIRKLVINNFGKRGIQIFSGLNVQILGNFIGTDSSGASAVPNTMGGIEVDSTHNTIGGSNGTSPAGSCTGDCNLISGNGGPGIETKSGGTTTQVTGNFIGTDVTGGGAVPNQGGGILSNAELLVVGGTFPEERNVISGNTGNGVEIGPAGSSIGGGVVYGNFIGTNSEATGAVANTGAGVYAVTFVEVGSTTGGAGNVISGNAGNGVDLEPGATSSVVVHNFIGTDLRGENSIANGSNGIYSNASSAVIGGTSVNERNIISGNGDTGIGIVGDNTLVQGNYLGTNASGDSGLPNVSGGIYLSQGAGNTIGGSASGAGNLIAAEGTGVFVAGATGSVIQGNLMGTEADGVTTLPNSYGIYVCCLAVNNTIGGTGPGEGNTIAFSSIEGVFIAGDPTIGPHGIAIRGNSIHDSAGQGITLGANANGGIMPPTITGQNPVVGAACANCKIDVFSDAADEGKTYHGSVTANGSGSWSFGGAVTGPNLTATATNAGNNTSEFSAPFVYTGPTATLPPSPSPTPVGQTPTPTPVAQTPSPTPVGQTATPTPTPTPSVTATPTTPPEGWHQGDSNCSGVIDIGDVTTILKKAGALLVAAGCPTYQDNVNCDAAIGDALDALGDLLYLANAGSLPTPSGCTPISDPIVI